MRWEVLVGGMDQWRADPGLAHELRELLPETTDDVPIP
jgi:hypothetical protein